MSALDCRPGGKSPKLNNIISQTLLQNISTWTYPLQSERMPFERKQHNFLFFLCSHSVFNLSVLKNPVAKLQLKYAFLSATLQEMKLRFPVTFCISFSQQNRKSEMKVRRQRELPSLWKMIGQLSSGPICDRQIFRLIFWHKLLPKSQFSKSFQSK